MVIEVVTLSSGMPSKSDLHVAQGVDRDAALPTSPSDARRVASRSPSASGNRRRSRGPSAPASSRYLKRLLVCSGVPKPANLRIVQRRPRYIVGCTPRVNGYSPGRPSVVAVADGLVGGGHQVGHLDAAPGGEARLARGDLLLGLRRRARPATPRPRRAAPRAPRVEPEPLAAGVVEEGRSVRGLRGPRGSCSCRNIEGLYHRWGGLTCSRPPEDARVDRGRHVLERVLDGAADDHAGRGAELVATLAASRVFPEEKVMAHLHVVAARRHRHRELRRLANRTRWASLPPSVAIDKASSSSPCGSPGTRWFGPLDREGAHRVREEDARAGHHHLRAERRRLRVRARDRVAPRRRRWRSASSPATRARRGFEAGDDRRRRRGVLADRSGGLRVARCSPPSSRASSAWPPSGVERPADRPPPAGAPNRRGARPRRRGAGPGRRVRRAPPRRAAAPAPA